MKLIKDNKIYLKEGLWSSPIDNISKIKILLDKPMNATEAKDKLYNLFGSDALYDELDEMEREYPDEDVRPIIKYFLKRFTRDYEPNKGEEDKFKEYDKKIQSYLEYLHEDFDLDKVESELNSSEDKIPDPPKVGDDMGIANTLNALIQDEWQAIEGYNSAIASIATLDNKEEILNILADIVSEEHVHIGQLQEALKLVSPNAISIAEGEREGASQLEEPNRTDD